VTTAAQYFHLLRRQALRLASDPRPLILMTPKSLLRHPMATSAMGDFTSGTFRPVIDDPQAVDRRDEVTRLILCSGKVAIDLDSSELRAQTPEVAVARVEQLAPFQCTAIGQVINAYPNLREIVWLQEEPQNMGSWLFVRPRLRELVDQMFPIRYIGRGEASSPAEGSLDTHNQTQSDTVARAFAHAPARDGAGVPVRAAGGGANGAQDTSNGTSVRANGATARSKSKPGTRS